MVDGDFLKRKAWKLYAVVRSSSIRSS